MISGIRASSYALQQSWSDIKDDDANYADKNGTDKDYADKDDTDKDHAEKDDLRNTSERLFFVLVAFSLAGLEDLVRSCACLQYFSFWIFCFWFLLRIIFLFNRGGAPGAYTLR